MITILNGNCLEILKAIPDETVDCCVTSPPYWGLRDYGVDDQLGQEKTPEEYVHNLVEVFRQVRRVLRHDGTIWLNLGDSYAAKSKNRTADQAVSKSGLGGGLNTTKQSLRQQCKVVSGLKPKDLVGIPWMVALALRMDGWYLRQDIVWNKPNVMPESVTDRCTKSHEYIFLLSKSEKYYFDHKAIKEPATHAREAKWDNGKNGHFGGTSHEGQGSSTRKFPADPTMRNKRSVWTVSTKPYKWAHFATFPPELIRPCILAGSRVGGTVLDPFFGAGTTALVASSVDRKTIGIELNNEYVELARKRLSI